MAGKAPKRICLDEIRELAGRYMSDNDLRALLEDVKTRRKSIRAEGKIAGLEEQYAEAAKQIAEKGKIAVIIEKRNQAIAMIKKKNLQEFVRRFKTPAQGIEAALVGIHTPVKGARQSVDALGHGYLGKYAGGLIADLRKTGTLGIFTSRRLDREIAGELHALTNPTEGKEPGYTGSKEAKGIADIVYKYQQVMRDDLNKAGAWINDINGFTEHQSHNPERLLKYGYSEWKTDTLKWLDGDKTFADVDAKDIEKFMRGTYDALTSGMHLATQIDPEKMAGFKGYGNLARKLSEGRVLFFQDGEAWHQYNTKYGRKDLIQTVLGQMEHNARNKALMEVFGPNPRQMFDTIMQDLKAEYRDKPKEFKDLTAKKLEDFWKELDGSTMMVGNATAAKVGRVLRSIASMSKLGGVVLSSINDIPNIMAELRRNGINPIQGYAEAFGNLFRGRAKGEVRQMADLTLAGVDGIVGDILSRFSARDDMPGTFSALSRRFMKLTGLTWWTDAHKTGVSHILQRNLAMNAGKEFAQLGDLGRMLSMYGIDEGKWNMLRRYVDKADNGREYLSADAATRITDDEVRTYLIGQGVDKSKIRNIQKFKDDLGNQLRTYLTDRVTHAVLEPGARERAFLMRGTQPGTLEGEVLRFVGQFKAFPTTMMTKVLGSEIYGKGANTLAEGLFKGKADYFGLAQVMLGTWAFGYLAMSAKDLMKGRTPRDPTEVSTMVSAFIQGGGAGIYGDFIFGEFNRFGRSALASLSGPVLSQIDDVAELWGRFKNGDDFGAKLFRFGLNNTPFINLFYSRIAMDYLFLYSVQESINPGYLRRMERRIQNENKQQMLFPPSRYAVGVR